MRPIALKRENATLHAKVNAFHRILDLLRDLPAEGVHDALHRLQIGSDPIAMLRTLQCETMIDAPSEQGLALSYLPQVHSQCELELLVRHPLAYPNLDEPPAIILPNFGHVPIQPLSPAPNSNSSPERLDQARPESEPHYFDPRL